jgi:capping protein beta
MIEEMEIKMRATIQEIYFGKTKDILNDLRSMTDLKTVKGQNAMVSEIFLILASAVVGQIAGT